MKRRAQRGHQACRLREDDARRRREELFSAVHDEADGCGPRSDGSGDIPIISVDLAAVDRLQAAVPLVLENGFDGCYEAGRVEVRASTGLAGARTAAQGASRAAARPAGVSLSHLAPLPASGLRRL